MYSHGTILAVRKMPWMENKSKRNEQAQKQIAANLLTEQARESEKFKEKPYAYTLYIIHYAH